MCAGCGDGGDEEARPDEEPRAGPAEPREMYRKLRGQALRLDPSDAGLRPSEELPRVFGVMMETGYPKGCATLLALADGTASLYLSPGGGFIGGGQRPKIAAASKRFVRVAEEMLDQIPESRSEDLPASGRVVMRALTYDGHHAAEAVEDDLGYNRHDLSPLFHAGHAVISRIREVDEAGR